MKKEQTQMTYFFKSYITAENLIDKKDHKKPRTILETLHMILSIYQITGNNRFIKKQNQLISLEIFTV